MADGNGSKSWWTTLPGVITAVAGVITAIAGLIGALVAGGIIGGSPTDNAGRGQSASGSSSSAMAGGVIGESQANNAGHGKVAPGSSSGTSATGSNATDVTSGGNMPAEDPNEVRKKNLSAAYSKLKGGWSWTNDENKVTFDQELLGRCEVTKHFEAHVTFDDLDVSNLVISGKYNYSHRISANYTPPNTAGLNYEDQEHNCNNAATGNMFAEESVLKEHGSIEGSPSDGDTSSVSVTRRLTGCVINSSQCSSKRTVPRRLGEVDIEDHDTIRLDGNIYRRD